MDFFCTRFEFFRCFGEMLQPTNDVLCFVFESAGFKCMRLIGLQTIDNHNRLWLEDEMLIHVQVLFLIACTFCGPERACSPFYMHI